MAILDNLVSYWKLDESSGNAADSVGGNTLTNVGTATFSAGKINNGANMASASNQYFTSANNAGIVGSNYSTFAWIKSTTDTEQVVIASSAGTGATLDGFFFLIAGDDTTNNLKFVEYNAGFATSSIADATGVFNDGNWHHVGFTVVADTTYNLYLDGRLLKTATVTARATTDHPFYVGRYMHASAGYLNGSIDELGLWSRALSASEVAYLYNNGRGVQYPNLQHNTLGEYLGAGSGITKGLYHLNGSSADYSGNNNNGTDTSITYSLANGKFGMGAVFNGSSSYSIVGTGLNTTLTSNAWTINLWAYIDVVTGSGTQFFMACDHNSGTRQFCFGYQKDYSKLYFERGGSAVVTNVGSTLSATTWTFISATYDGTNLRTYINGVLNTTTAMSALASSANNLYLARRQYPSFEGYFAGREDGVIIENVAWDAAKIKKYYTYAKGRYGII